MFAEVASDAFLVSCVPMYAILLYTSKGVNSVLLKKVIAKKCRWKVLMFEVLSDTKSRLYALHHPVRIKFAHFDVFFCLLSNTRMFHVVEVPYANCGHRTEKTTPSEEHRRIGARDRRM